MDPLFWWWLGITLVAGLGMIGMVVWGFRHPKSESDRIVKLSDLIIGTAVVLCPIINVFVAIGMIAFFFSEIAPNIVLFGGKK